jgi:imidazolonepropionase-like amidohydrolase
MHLRGTVLPADERLDLWVIGDRISLQPPAGAASTVLSDGYLLPGLVDVHTHPGKSQAGFDVDTFIRECTEHAAAGVAAVRFPGLGGPVPAAVRERPDLPRMVRGGGWLAWSGLSDHAEFHSVVDDLPAAAVAQVRGNDGWCKIFADWDIESDPVPLTLLAAVVSEVHRAGGRVAAHCQTRAGTLNAAIAGVDSIEHGMGMPGEAVPAMARHDIAYVPTLTAFAQSVPVVRERQTARSRLWLRGHQAMIRGVRDAFDAGVTVLAGTDSEPFGNVVTEVEHLTQAGLPVSAAIGAASWTARRWLGLPGIVEGGSADLVAYDVDPRAEPGVLRHPRLVVLRGRVVRRPLAGGTRA